MTIVLNGTSGITNVNGSAAAPAETGVDTDTGIFFPAANTLGFSTNGAEVARFDSSGNLGLGVTPSAWGSSFKALQMSYATMMNASSGGYFGSNFYYNSSSNPIYVNNGYALAYSAYSAGGAHLWLTAPSGTAGGAISWTQAMTLDASGNLGVGSTSPASALDIYRAGGATVDISHSTSGGTYPKASGIGFGATSTGYSVSSNGGTVTFYGGAGIYANNTASSGNPTSLVFWTNSAGTPAEAMRIDTSGNLLVGSSSTIFSYSKTVQVTAANGSIPYSCVNSGYAARTWKFGAEGVGGAYIVFNGSDVGAYISYGGTSWTATSDERLKTDLVPIENAAQKVSTLRAVTGRYKTDDETVSRAFLIAQDVQAVLPQAVTEQGDENKTLGLAYSEVIPLLVAAIKEQQAIITQLQADVAALKGQA